MSFWQKIKQTFRSFMTGRHGSDQLGLTLIWVGLGVYILSAVFNSGLLSLLSFVIYGYTLFRMFSRNERKRADENRRYLAFKTRLSTGFKQARAV